jgi:hypothetical protein
MIVFINEGYTMPSKVLNVQGCDTTNVDSSSAAKYIKNKKLPA